MSSAQIEQWAVVRLQATPKKLRKNDYAVKRMMASMEQYGFRIPVLVTGVGEIIDGDLRLKAARALGLAEVPVIVCDDWTPEQVRGFRLLANRSATWAEWDWEAVAEELKELSGQNYDLSLTGFDSREIESLLCPRETPGSCLAQEAKGEEAISTLGDVWQVGEHRIICGDATDAANVQRVLQSAAPVLMATDPPYGVSYDPQWREQAGLGAARQVGRVQK